jgi:4-hydroxythreonine-4-phosphate dehydrogenase
MGDYNGIGPEIILKVLTQHSIWQRCNPLVIGSLDVLAWYARKLRIRCWLQEVEDVPKKFVRHVVPVMQVRQFHSPNITPGKISEEAGRLSGEAVEKAVELCQNGVINAMVTAPVSKEALDNAGYHYPGQTEMLAELTNAMNVTMLLIANSLRVGLATVHTPIMKVAKQLKKKSIVQKIYTISDSLKSDFALRSPKLAVLGLNPHAGEHGMFGDEELKEILPAIQFAKQKKMQVDGPFPADGFFGSKKFREYDAVLAMYHDQGLIPMKMMGFNGGVNFSAGLPIVRTSPDHGTAFDIAGKGNANPSSMVEAILLAVKISNHRKSKNT